MRTSELLSDYINVNVRTLVSFPHERPNNKLISDMPMQNYLYILKDLLSGCFNKLDRVVCFHQALKPKTTMK